MRRIHSILIALLTAFTAAAPLSAQPPPAADPTALFRDGLKHYRDGNFTAGLAAFTAARTNLPPGGVGDLDAARIDYNIGLGLHRLDEPGAAASFEAALRSPDLDLQQAAYHNLGTIAYQAARALLDEGDVATAFQGFQKAAPRFIQAMRLNPDDLDAKINYELSLAAQQRILTMVAEAIARLQQGEQLVSDYRFVEAAQWFQQQLPMVEQALELEPEQKKIFQTMTERSGAVAGLLAPPAPAAEGQP
jgi:tetratricopeptide (TPR) repeat protein